MDKAILVDYQLQVLATPLVVAVVLAQLDYLHLVR